MNTSNHHDQNSSFLNDDALGCTPGDAQKISDTDGKPEPVDIVHAEIVDGPISSRKGKQGAALRRGTEKKRVRGYETRRRLIELHVFAGKRLVECARELGISYGRTLGVWHAVVAEVHGSKGAPDEHLRAVRGYLDLHYRRVIEESQGRLGEAASYGAAVIAACKALADLHGLGEEKAADVSLSLEDVGREVRVVSPLLMDKLERIRRLVGQDGNSETAEIQSTSISVGGVPVEGTVAGTEQVNGLGSPLLEGSVSERMLSGVMRVGQMAVKRAQMDGVEVAINSIPGARIARR